ncbi:MAG: phosphotransferase [Thermoanaerobaculia bacterium]
MRIGIDFDNTLVDYDRLFHKVACEWKAIDEQTPPTKLAVRTALREAGQEQRWTEMQGYVYGARMDEAAPYPGALDFLRRANDAGHVVAIISHKTLHPFAGPAYDLHAAARAWIERHLVHEGKPLVPRERVFFELTKEAKLARIADFGCDLFIDDLPELLLDESFPTSVTTRVLFDPDRRHSSHALSLLHDWSEASCYLASDDAHAAIASLLAMAGIVGEPRAIALLHGSGNNRVHRVETDAGTFVAKQYFRDERDTRDRLAAEYAFLRYAAIAAPGFTPRAYAGDRERGWGLYEYVKGQPFGDVGEAELEAAIRFFGALQRSSAAATDLPVASEACFSIAAHLDLIGLRVRRLAESLENSEGDAEASRFMRNVRDFWEELAAQIAGEALREGIDFHAPLEPNERCISPSDFGFHNALREPDGNIRFIDFEYAGWDDPAKTAGDFFAQISVPVPQEFFDRFVQSIATVMPDPETVVRRAHLLRAAYRVKWCCIAMNVFHSEHLARRTFADPSIDVGSLKAAQLAKAETLFRSVVRR